MLPAAHTRAPRSAFPLGFQPPLLLAAAHAHTGARVCLQKRVLRHQQLELGWGCGGARASARRKGRIIHSTLLHHSGLQERPSELLLRADVHYFCASCSLTYTAPSLRTERTTKNYFCSAIMLVSTHVNNFHHYRTASISKANAHHFTAAVGLAVFHFLHTPSLHCCCQKEMHDKSATRLWHDVHG